jgi:hypothetical protein
MPEMTEGGCSLFPLQQLRQPGEIHRHPARFVEREHAGQPCGLRIGATVKCTQALPGGVLDRIAAGKLDNAPWRRESAGRLIRHVRLRSRSSHSGIMSSKASALIEQSLIGNPSPVATQISGDCC